MTVTLITLWKSRRCILKSAICDKATRAFLSLATLALAQLQVKSLLSPIPTVERTTIGCDILLATCCEGTTRESADTTSFLPRIHQSRQRCWCRREGRRT